jgi:DNA polymerase III epsilon subunit-like protein
MIVIDIETTGLDPKRNSILEIGAIDFQNPENWFNCRCRVWDGAEIDLNALAINGYTVADTTDPAVCSHEELLVRFIKWTDDIHDKTLAGQNVDFDIDFLNEGFKRAGIPFQAGKRKVDQHSIAYARLLKGKITPPLADGFSNLNSDLIMNLVGLPAEPKPHKALNGAKYQCEALSRLIFGKGLFDEFAVYKIPRQLQIDAANSKKRKPDFQSH